MELWNLSLKVPAVSSVFYKTVLCCQAGNVACATSTGGITGKREGRVGDSPLVGCGGYADNNTGGKLWRSSSQDL